MRNAERRRASSRTQAINSLRDAAAYRSPDARLVAACHTFLVMDETAEQLYRTALKGYAAKARATQDERDRLAAEIAALPARTPIGFRAKAEVAIRRLGREGTYLDIPRSIIEDFLAGLACLHMEEGS